MRLRRVAPVAVSLVLLLTSLLAWAWFTPHPLCDDPACVRQRFTLDLELDRFERVDPIALQIVTEEGEVSVASVIGSGGIDVRIRPEDRRLPLAVSETLDRADLYAFAQEWRTRTSQPGADATLYAMLAPAIVSDTGEELFGLMFDAEDRSGFAMAPAEVARRFDRHEPDTVPLLQMRTFIHEMLHALNRRHGEAAQMPGERLTIEAPTRCISDNIDKPHWTLRERPLMALSPSTIRFFQSAPAARVLPGPANSPFLAGSPSTCSDVRESIAVPTAISRWDLATRRLKRALRFPQVQAAEVEESDEDTEAVEAAEGDEPDGAEKNVAAPDVDVHLQAMTAAYPLGYPVAIRVVAINRGERTLPLVGRLSPGYGLLRIEIRRAPDEDWNPIEPLAWYEPIDDAAAMLQPGAKTEQTVPIFFDRAQWTFPVAGDYEVRARLNLGDEFEPVVTDSLTVRMEAPQAGADRAALQLISDDEGRLRNDIGRLLLLQGRLQDPQATAAIDELVNRFTDTALGVSVQLTRASRLLRRPIDPKTGQRPRPDIAAARELLADSCSDSGVAALRRQLLDFHEDTTGSQPAPAMLEPVEAAWDGAVPKGSASVATYLDSGLEVAPQVFHFCADAELRGRVASAATAFARQLRTLRAERIVLVGHSDRAGTCRSNDSMSMRRAEAMRAALIHAGVDRRSIQVVSLGKRRPVDFASSAHADALNRRVEVLVPGSVADGLRADAPSGPILPECPGETVQASGQAIP
ncbi:OmpA family protein [Povalibacter sp.]|uniref:OmpA family protein n=1 Tax=Povalibacter sp. TaxID=1962978 RepID=UPI002F41DE14